MIDLLISALGDEREDVAERAEDLLELLAPESVDALVIELTLGLAPERAAAVLGRIKDARALEPLVAALRHPSAQVRAESCLALGELRDPAASEPLLGRHARPRAPGPRRRRGGARPDRHGRHRRERGLAAAAAARAARPRSCHAGARTRGRPSATRSTNGNADGDAENGFHTTLLRRLARFIDRVEDARGRAASPRRPARAT